MIGVDACSPALARNVHRRFVQVAAPLEAENPFPLHALGLGHRRARWASQFSGPLPLSLSQSYLGYTITTSACNFLKE